MSQSQNNNSILSPFQEMAAYEALWLDAEKKLNTYKRLSEVFRDKPGVLPSSFTTENKINDAMMQLLSMFKNNFKPNVLINHTLDYPKRLMDAEHPLELIYYSGNINYLNEIGIAIVGSRKPSHEGIKRTEQLVKLLLNDGYIIYSGLATGIDTAAHKATIKFGGKTVGVIGTPLNTYYPKENKQLQDIISKEHLLVSQVPFIKYSEQDYRWNRSFFPERNKTMSALSQATIIVEAGETSGSLIQAKAALKQGRKLFILQSCFENPKITWPSKFEKLGAIRVRVYDDIKNILRNV